ncbi:MAG TPA: hypothetical protein VKI65_06155, partial [Gemmataceae bacterium]|nr:hypothetical protein [Gemmataceae bacterium]
MSAVDTSPPRPARRYWLWLVAIGAIALGVGGYTIWAGWKLPQPGVVPSPSSGDPRVTYETPFLNVRPEVQYVGDAKCALCHSEHCDSFRQHPMGRSLMPVSEMIARERYDKAAHSRFEANGFHYVVEQRGKKMIHREELRDPQGRVVEAIEEEAVYALGSSANGRSYIINRRGYLYQSPISWYEQPQRWDISPSYQQLNLHWDKPTGAACLFCHSNQANPVPYTDNQFREPIFQGYSIGCERCHGPGQLHVEARDESHPRFQRVEGKIDYTIVNPRHLDPPLREAVCQQCHLQGHLRILARGRDFWDFRPGLPLHLFY